MFYVGNGFSPRSFRMSNNGFWAHDGSQEWFFYHNNIPFWLLPFYQNWRSGGYGSNYGGGLWSPWNRNPFYTQWPSYQRGSSGFGFLAGLALGGLAGRGRRR